MMRTIYANNQVRRWLALGLLFCLFGGGLARGAGIPPAAWRIEGAKPDALLHLADDDMTTAHVAAGDPLDGIVLTLDLGRTYWLHRIWFAPPRTPPGEGGKTPALDTLPRVGAGEEASSKAGETPTHLRLLAGETVEELRKLDTIGLDPKRHWLKDGRIGVELDAVFAPLTARYVRITIPEASSAWRLEIGEFEAYGCPSDAPPSRGGIVAIRGASSPTLRLAARELRYYLQEITSAPHRIVVEDAMTPDAPGGHYVLVAPPPEPIPNPVRDPVDLEDFSVRDVEGVVRFEGRTQRAVLYAVYEFLHAQGVRWVYPDAHGDVVPRRDAVDRSMLPISHRSDFSTRMANLPVHQFPASSPPEQRRRWYIRNHFNQAWGTMLTHELGGTPARMRMAFGFAHSLQSKILERSVMKQHPEWAGEPNRERAVVKQSWSTVPCLSKPDFRAYIAERIVEIVEAQPEVQGIGIHPTDNSAWCECEACRKMIEPIVYEPLGIWIPKTPSYSDLWFPFVAEIAEKTKDAIGANRFVHTLAYSDHHRPPSTLETLPENLFVTVCQYWVRNLPPSHPANALMRERMETWCRMGDAIGVWDYALWHVDGPVTPEKNKAIQPLVAGLVDQYRFLHRMGVRHVAVQATDTQRENPWNYYAWARTAWAPDQPASEIRREFFRGYYGDAGEAMLAWYVTLESYLRENGIRTHRAELCPPFGGAFYGCEVYADAFPPKVVEAMRKHLANAMTDAATWVERERVDYAKVCFDQTLRLAEGAADSEAP